MRGTPLSDMTDLPIEGQEQAYEYSYRQRQRTISNSASFEQSVGYRLATEGPNSNMGAAGQLQVWPEGREPKSRQKTKLKQDHESQNAERAQYHRSVSESISSRISPIDVSSLHSYYDVAKAPMRASQQHIARPSTRDTAPRKRPTIHAAVSQPDFRAVTTRERERERERERDSHYAELSSKTPQSHRSHRMDFSKFFSSRHKEGKKLQSKKGLQNCAESRIEERAKLDRESFPHHHVHRLAETPAKTGSICSQTPVGQRAQYTSFDRNPTENAKINQRRPPKGIKHWFEGLDDSDDDFPEVVETTPPAQVPTSHFRPSLGPGRARVAPTSRISPSADSSSDYFQFTGTSDGHEDSVSPLPSEKNATRGGFQQGRSVLVLSSSEDEDDASEPPSPDPWTEHTMAATMSSGPSERRSQTAVRDRSNGPRESVTSMQTMLTSASIPIINGDAYFHTQLPPLPSGPPPATELPTPPSSKTRQSQSLSQRSASRSRSATQQSVPESLQSELSHTSSLGNSHLMAVTQEEMQLLELMRRKRAEMADKLSPGSPHSSSRGGSPCSRQRRTSDRHSSVAHSIASSHVSRSSERQQGPRLDCPDGTVFPAPPLTDRTSMQRMPSADSTVTRHRSRDHTASKLTMTHHAHRNEKENQRPDTPNSPTFVAELEASTPQLTTTTSRPPRRKSSTPSTSATKTPAPPPPYNSADPYSLAPDLEFSPLDLLPLPARMSMYAPSLTTAGSRTSEGAGSRSETSTPPDTGRSAAGLGRGGLGCKGEEMAEEMCELGGDGGRDGSLKGEGEGDAGDDVMAAWNSLGGI